MATGAGVSVGNAVLGVFVADFPASPSCRRPAAANLFLVFSFAALAVGVASVGVAATVVRVVAITCSGLLQPLESTAAGFV